MAERFPKYDPADPNMGVDEIFAHAQLGDPKAREAIDNMARLETLFARLHDPDSLSDRPAPLPPSPEAVPESVWTGPEYWQS